MSLCLKNIIFIVLNFVICIRPILRKTCLIFKQLKAEFNKCLALERNNKNEYSYS